MRVCVAWVAMATLGTAYAQPVPADDGTVVASMAMPAVTQSTRAAVPHLDQGYALLDDGQSERAMSELRLAVDEEVGSLRALRALGLAAALDGSLDDAELALHRAASVEPNDLDTVEMLAMVRARRGDWQGAQAMFQRVVRADAARGASWLGLARAYLALDRGDDALSAVDEAVRLEVAGALLLKVEALEASGDRRAARQLRRSL